jgi:hypothetical protein
VSALIAERIEFCKELRRVKLVPLPDLHRTIPRNPCVYFQVETTSGKILTAEGCPVLVISDYESWQRQVVITGIYKRFPTLRIGVELLTPTADPFLMIRPEWYAYKLHIPSGWPLRLGSERSYQIHQSNFE